MIRLQMKVTICFVLALTSHLVSSQEDICKVQQTCGACIRTPTCVWCSQQVTDDPTVNMVRCQSRQTSSESCPAAFIVNPLPEFSEERPSSEWQLTPQRVSLKNIRIGESFNISVQFTPAKNYPLDLYFLMDLSNSMGEHRRNVEKFGSELARKMRNITSNFKLGFGSFVDKDTIPIAYNKIDPDRCFNDKGDIVCRDTYSFKHRMTMDSKEDRFVAEVGNALIVKTLDLPDGGLDGLLQAIVCGEIGWSDRSRRLIVFVTDAVSHVAGHGKIGGIVAPNDGKCHMDNYGNYTIPLQQDYPSLGQLSRLVQDNSINLVFAVTDEVVPSYAMLSRNIKGSTVGILAEDSGNIVELIERQYKTISSSVQLKAATTAAVGVRFFTSCNGAPVQERDKCTNLVDGQTTSFTVNIEAKECPRNGKQFITIYPVGVNESLTVELDIVCDCPCERPGNPGFEENSEHCNFQGNQVCGVCECPKELQLKCKPDNQTRTCSDQGKCFCGKCYCNKRPNPLEIISGQYCECNNYSCTRSDGKICSNNGECKCSKCVCNEGWTGDACECRSSNDTCMPLGGDEYCLGNGVCECGSCQCKPGASGKFCEDCEACPDRCREFIPCVQCKVSNSGPYMNQTGLCEQKCSFDIDPVEDLFIEASHERKCSYKVEDNCEIQFIYGYHPTTGARRVRVLTRRVCPEETPIMATMVGLSLAFLLLGLLVILLCRLYTYLHDRREYARFEEEHKRARWNTETSPLYVNPNHLTVNPMFGTHS